MCGAIYVFLLTRALPYSEHVCLDIRIDMFLTPAMQIKVRVLNLSVWTVYCDVSRTCGASHSVGCEFECWGMCLMIV